jgi:PAS domain-containing protein
MSDVRRPGECDFLSGGGEMGARMRAFDWTTTSLGPPEAWPQHLKNAIALFLGGAATPSAEEALRESEARLRAVIEEAPLAIALTGPSGEILLRNPRFDQLWGRPAHTTTAPHLQRRVRRLPSRRPPHRIGGVAGRSRQPSGTSSSRSRARGNRPA